VRVVRSDMRVKKVCARQAGDPIMSMQSSSRTDARPRVLFIYPSRPTTIAATIEIAISRLKLVNRNIEWYSWREVKSQGKVIPNAVSREIGACAAIVVDMTSLNLNVAFELGLAVGLGVPVLPIRDVSYQTGGGGSYRALGFVEALGCIDFRNSDDLVKRLGSGALPAEPPPAVDSAFSAHEPAGHLARSRRVLTVNGSFDTEGVRQLAKALEAAQVETDVVSTSWMSSLLENLPAMVSAAAGVVVHLMDTNRGGIMELLEPNCRGVSAENTRGIFIAGVTQGVGVPLILLQEGHEEPSVDYGRLVCSYADPSRIPQLLEDFLTGVLDSFTPAKGDYGALVRLSDLLIEPAVLGPKDPTEVLAACLDTSPTGLAEAWSAICVPLVSGQASRSYILRRTSNDHRDVADFMRSAAKHALANCRTRITPSDIHHAESLLSHVAKARIKQKLICLQHDGSRALDAFTGINEIVPADEIRGMLAAAGLRAQEANEALAVLLDAGAIGVWDPLIEAPTFNTNTERADDWTANEVSEGVLLAVHPSLHAALHVCPHALGAVWPPVWSAG
jgi:hypothetical protein